ncbi:hypothetical protein JS533_007560 [Bifidobacterium amazonense]|uniref:Uncharacterized protein n=1 Tax=Bifidobacterium amazonense TaxID=2809027 RepID=A0ABS9VWE7_9BIFI|nr:hypothetical protein [Bifidobacterium amazonense]MCH9276125.1 hypothetical protein [Bifidobacterium amazonense]
MDNLTKLANELAANDDALYLDSLKATLAKALENAGLALTDPAKAVVFEYDPATIAKIAADAMNDDEEDDEDPVTADPEDFTEHLRALALMAHENLAHIETDALAHKWADIHGIAVNGKNIITRLVHAIDELED